MDKPAKKPKRPSSASATAQQEPKTPRCEHCTRELTARDAAYGGKGALCKRCKQDRDRAAIKGRFTPFVRSEIVGGKRVNVLVKGNRAIRRHPVTLPLAPDGAKPKIPRASRRAATRRQASQKAKVA